jgi:hypothetical protein
VREIYKTPEQLKALEAAFEKGDLQAIAEFSPIAAWNTLRFRAAGELVRTLFTELSTAAKTRPAPFPIYLQSLVNSDGGEWFGTWDQPDKLPIIQSIQAREDYPARLQRSARAVSKTVLYSHSFQQSDQVPLPPPDKFAFDFNRYGPGDADPGTGTFSICGSCRCESAESSAGSYTDGTPVIMSPSRASDVPNVRRR